VAVLARLLLSFRDMPTSQSETCRYSSEALENLSTAVLLFGTDARLLFMNPAAEMMLQVSARAIKGTPAAYLLRDPKGAIMRIMKQSLSSGDSVNQRALSLKRADESVITVDCTVKPMFSDDKEPVLLLEMDCIDRRLRISREQNLIQQQEAVQDLFRRLAHEIKNPLGGLRGAAQLLNAELPAPDLAEYTDIIIAEADRLKNLVDSMLGPRQLPRRESLNVHQVLERVRVLILAERKGGRLRIERDYDPSIPELTGDRDQLLQALLNVARNASRAVDGDGVIELRTRILRQFTIGGELHRLVTCIQIIDNGPGIDESIREKLFYPMVTASEDGMGLGLTIAQSLINQHGGLIECDSVPGHTIFSIYLPLDDTTT